MPTHPIGERPMTSGERSARLVLKHRKAMAEMRNSFNNSFGLLMKAGSFIAENGNKEDAYEYFREAEIHSKHLEYLNERLAPYEKEIHQPGFVERKGFETHKPAERLLVTKNLSGIQMTALQRQAVYEADRASRRPEINARYGHLAKAEKPEPLDIEELKELEPQQAGVAMVEHIQPVRDNGN